MEKSVRPETDDKQVVAAIFDLDGVLTETTELHYRSWRVVADELDIPFDRRAYEEMRGLNRSNSLAILLRGQEGRFSEAEQQRLAERKNEEYLRLVAEMTPSDLFPGALELLHGLRARGVRVAVASSSRNAGRVVERLGIGPLLDVIVDANTAPRSKPDPQVFLVAAELLGVPPARCVVVEDAEAGVAAGVAAGMWVIGIGPAERVGQGHAVVSSIGELSVDAMLRLLNDRAR
ncbi:MAG: beta-phosphoglucomutase [Phycisphaerae bacterium]|nr:beta-phosphoglucomutase [Phycisphaerae bacterium]